MSTARYIYRAWPVELLRWSLEGLTETFPGDVDPKEGLCADIDRNTSGAYGERH